MRDPGPRSAEHTRDPRADCYHRTARRAMPTQRRQRPGATGFRCLVLLDVNVLVNAMRKDAPRHKAIHAYVETLRSAPEPFGLSDVVLSGVLRVLTHPRIFSPPTPAALARDYIAALRASSNAVILSPGARHWGIFISLLERSGAIGNLGSDAWYAALAIEHGCEWISMIRILHVFQDCVGDGLNNNGNTYQIVYSRNHACSLVSFRTNRCGHSANRDDTRRCITSNRVRLRPADPSRCTASSCRLRKCRGPSGAGARAAAANYQTRCACPMLKFAAGGR